MLRGEDKERWVPRVLASDNALDNPLEGQDVNAPYGGLERTFVQ